MEMSLQAEWERLDILGACLSLARSGDEITSAMKERLQEVQQQVRHIRAQQPWQSLVQRHRLNPLDQDILACVVAPEAEPRLGWMYQDLQPGLVAPYPTPALIREIFFLDLRESEAMRERLSSRSPLFGKGLIRGECGDLFGPLKPSELACSALLGWFEKPAEAPPGAVEIVASGGWDDLVLPHASRTKLREFLLWIEQWDRVVGDWGARAQGGPVALFAGPSGTGKTFAAEVVAKTLDWPLFRVDLGLLVSKYIGETEKNLNALFDAAHDRKMVLLFDEADSLFGKRGDVKEARDRYANMEVSHLLSRMERHRGPCILTSNLRRHLDPAFARRFQIVVEFPRPDATARVGLWRMHFPSGAPIDDEIDMEQLGAELTMTGGQIRNIAVHAAFLAAGEDAPISRRHVASAVWTELAKEGRELMPSMLGSLAVDLPVELEE